MPSIEAVPPVVAAFLHVDEAVAAPVRRTTTTFSMVGHLDAPRRRSLERRRRSAAIAAVGGDQHLRLRVVDPVAQRLGREAAEDDRVDGADPGAGEHRDRQLGGHRHVDRDAVALRDAERLEHVGELVHLPVEVPVGVGLPVAGLAYPDERGLVAARPLDVPVDAVVRGVELPADEPLRVGRVPLEHLVPLHEPVELFCPAWPRSPRGRARLRRRATRPGRWPGG